MRVVSLDGNVGTPVDIGDTRHVAGDGTPYYWVALIVDGRRVDTIVHAAKAWRIREHLDERHWGHTAKGGS